MKLLDLDRIFDNDRSPRAAGSTAVDLTPSDLPGDWHVLWDERSAIMEYDGGLPRELTEHLALLDILRQMRAASC